MRKFLQLVLFACVLNLGVLSVKADILMITVGAIKRYSDDGALLDTLVDDVGIGMHFDATNGVLYFANNTGGISRADRTGANVQTIISGAASIVADLAVDHINSKLLWTDQVGGRVRRSNLDGSGAIEDIVSGLLFPAGIFVDAENGHLYYSAVEHIYRSNLDGSGATIVVTDDSFDGANLGRIVVRAGKIYWANFSEGTVKSANLDGSEITELAGNGLAHRVEGLAYSAARNALLYCGIPLDGTLLSTVGLDGSGQAVLADTGGFDIIADYSLVAPTPTPTPTATPMATPYPLKDLAAGDARIYVSVGNHPEVDIFWTSVSGARDVTVLNSPSITGVGALAYSHARTTLYFVAAHPEEGLTKSIYRMNPDGGEPTLLTGLPGRRESVIAMTFDDASDKLFVMTLYETPGLASGVIYALHPEDGELLGFSASLPGVFPVPGLATSGSENIFYVHSKGYRRANQLVQVDSVKLGDISSAAALSKDGIFGPVFFGHQGKITYASAPDITAGRSPVEQFQHASTSGIKALGIQPLNFLESSNVPYSGFYALNETLRLFDATPGATFTLIVRRLSPGTVNGLLAVPLPAGSQVLDPPPTPTPPPPGQTPSGKVTVSGTIQQSPAPFAVETKKLDLANIPVFLRPSTPLSGSGAVEAAPASQIAFTNQSGGFTFKNVPRGDYTITFKREGLGFFPGSFNFSTESGMRSVTAVESATTHKGCAAKSHIAKLRTLNTRSAKLAKIALRHLKAAGRKGGKTVRAAARLSARVQNAHAAVVTKTIELPAFTLSCGKKASGCVSSNVKAKIKAVNKSIKKLRSLSLNALQIASGSKTRVSVDDISSVQAHATAAATTLQRFPRATWRCDAEEE